MPTSPRAQRTDFSLDIAGRYTCNGLDEALASVGSGGRPFDLIVVGGGSFGAALAQQLFANDQAQVHRILVLEGGPLALPEHVQNMPLQGLGVPPATSIAQLRSQGLDGQPRAEVWGLAWHSSTPFPGLAYCLAGRSLYFGGWSPQLLDDEMPTAVNAPSRWPQAVVNDLNNRYFAESATQIGTEETNDFIFGPLQNALRQALYDGINNGVITEAIPLGNLPDHPVLRNNPGANAARLRELLRDGSPLSPTPRRQIPVWIASWGSKAGLRRVARLGDGWFASAYNTTPDDFEAARESLSEELSARDRDPDSFPNALVTMWTWITEDARDAERVLRDVLAPLLKRDPEALRHQVCIGPAESCAELLSRYAQAGCQRVHLWPLGDEPRQIELAATAVLPAITT